MSIFPLQLQEFFLANQNILWLVVLALDLSMTVLMYRFFGKQGLLASIVLAILLSNLQGPKLTMMFGMQTSLGVILYSGIYFATDLLSEKYADFIIRGEGEITFPELLNTIKAGDDVSKVKGISYI